MTTARSVGVAIVGWGGIAKVHTLALRALPVIFPDSPVTVRQMAVVTRDVAGKHEAILRAGFAGAVETLDEALADAGRKSVV